MSLLYRALKKAEDKGNKPDPEPSPQLMAQDDGDKPRTRSSHKGLLGLLLTLSVAVIGGLYWSEIENLLAPRAVPVAASAPVIALAGPTAEEQRLAEEARLAEEQHLADEARLAEEQRLAEEARLADEQRLAEQRLAEQRRLAAINAQLQAEMATRLAEEQRRLDEIEVAARADRALINEALEEARREREALALAQRLAREQTEDAAAAAREVAASAKAALAALRDEIAKQRAAFEQITPSGQFLTPSTAAEAPQPEPIPETVTAPSPPPTESAGAALESGGKVDVGALVTRQAGEPAPLAPSGPIIIERKSERKNIDLAGLITVIDESDYFRDRYDAARRGLNAGGALSALSIYDDLLGRQPRDRVALLGRATALHQLNRSGEAIRAYETALRHHPDELVALTNLLGLIGQQTPESALQQLRRLYKRNPSFGAVAAQMAMIHLTLGDGPNAIRLMSEAATLEPVNPVYQINLAIMHDRAGDARAAVSAYQRALLVAGGSAEALPLSVDAIRERLRYLRAN